MPTSFSDAFRHEAPAPLIVTSHWFEKSPERTGEIISPLKWNCDSRRYTYTALKGGSLLRACWPGGLGRRPCSWVLREASAFGPVKPDYWGSLCGAPVCSQAACFAPICRVNGTILDRRPS